MRRAEYQRTVQTGLMGDRSRSNGHHGFTRTHFGIDDGGRLVFHQQQLIDRAYHIALCIKQLAGQTVHHRLVFGVGLAGENGLVLSGDGIEKTGTKIIEKLGQRQFVAVAFKLGQQLVELIDGFNVTGQCGFGLHCIHLIEFVEDLQHI